MNFLSRGLNNFRKFLGLSEDVRTRSEDDLVKVVCGGMAPSLCAAFSATYTDPTHSSVVQPVNCSPQFGGRGHGTKDPLE